MKRIFLTLSSGRCGTQKLSTLLNLVPDMYAEHEGNGFHAVRLANAADPNVGAEFVRQQIAHYNARPEKYIAHTGHMAGLGFYEHFLDQGIVPDIITLRRPMREVALSMYRLNWIPGKVKLIEPWYTNPGEPGVLPYDGWQDAHPYQLCYWWCIESERRIRHYQSLFKSVGSKTFEISLRGMLNLEYFNEMMKHLDLPKLDAIPQEKVNHHEVVPRIPVTKLIPPDAYLTELEQGVLEKVPFKFPTIQDMGVDDASRVTSEVMINTYRTLSFSVREEGDRVIGYIKPRSLEI